MSYPQRVLFVIALVLAIFVLPSPWGIVAVVGAIVLDLVEVGVGLWWNRRRKADCRRGMCSSASTGVAVGELRPVGQVKVNGEIWSAQLRGRVRRRGGCRRAMRSTG